MCIGIMQPYFFPYIGYFQLVNAVDTFVIYDDVNYIKKGWITRNNILVNGKSFLFSISLDDVSQNKQINQITISDNTNWRNNLLKTIEFSYKKAPFFMTAFPLIQDIILNQEKKLSNYLFYSIQKISNYFAIETNFKISSEIKKNDDLRGQDKIIEIIKKLDAKKYINPIGGIELYEKEKFINNNIKLNFIKSNTINYTQFGNDFIPWLSIIDVMMFNSPERINGFLNEYELV